jgi:hypothetical protein
MSSVVGCENERLRHLLLDHSIDPCKSSSSKTIYSLLDEDEGEDDTCGTEQNQSVQGNTPEESCCKLMFYYLNIAII